MNNQSPLFLKLKIAVAGGLMLALSACGTVDLNDAGASAGGEGAGATAAASASPSSNAQGGQNAVKSIDLGSSAGQADAVPNLVKVLYFDFDSYILKEEYANLIAQHAQVLAADGSLRVVLEGHTDELGSREYNVALGQQRAEAVLRALTLLGARANQVEAVSFGEEKPASLGGDAQSRALNRRVEISYR